ncbi:MAG: hypothetical protein ACJARE_001899 [Paracoccaceae bacterium]
MVINKALPFPDHQQPFMIASNISRCRFMRHRPGTCPAALCGSFAPNRRASVPPGIA